MLMITLLDEISLIDDSCGMESPSSNDGDASLRRRPPQDKSQPQCSEALSKESNLGTFHDADTDTSQQNNDFTNLSGRCGSVHQFGGV